MTNKNIIIAIVLSLAVMLIYPPLLKKFYPQSQAPETSATAGKEAEVKPVAGPQANAAAAFSGKAAPATQPLKEVLTVVETPFFKAIFTNIGGGIKKWELKKFRESQTPNARVVSINGATRQDATFTTRFRPAGAKETTELVFQLKGLGPLRRSSPIEGVKPPSGKDLNIAGNQSAELVFVANTKDGLRIEKKYVFSGSSYRVSSEVSIIGAKAVSGSIETLLSASFDAGEDAAHYHTGPVIQTKDKLLRQDLSKEPLQTGGGEFKWLGLESKYFLEVFIPLKGVNPKTPAAVSWTTQGSGSGGSKAALQTQIELRPNEKAVYAYDIFIGPKEYDLLLAQKNGLEEAIEFGWFSFMAKPLLVVLNFFERYLGNYGIAIVIITVIIKIIFYPLTKHSMKSMKEMQLLQPQMAALREKYKSDKQKMNKEVMDLYKRYKINPVSGCLPMILQIPVFIALYEVLYVAIELRHAPLFLWIADLSAKDPYYVTPVLMGITMFIQQKMTPTSMDPTQAKIMLIMPVIFTFMFLNFPAGLVVYWLINNVLSIAQQYNIHKTTAAKA
ncbi:MAG: membrane protein insertase YidC [Deltaproteobacteria bacterium]|nr:membrane protein insertase YidC [Deltaproteobacteria bacterium]